MREILFRGKTDKGEWVQGVPFFEEDRCYIIEDLFICDEYDCTGAVNTMVIPETVGQYTGLTDKNGTKIFEGDILQTTTIDTNEDVKALVGFGEFVDENNDDEYLGFYIEFSGIKTTIIQLLDEDTKDDFDIVGNIHDNPELLGGDN